jgi:hypothetical protein
LADFVDAMIDDLHAKGRNAGGLLGQHEDAVGRVTVAFDRMGAGDCFVG